MRSVCGICVSIYLARAFILSFYHSLARTLILSLSYSLSLDFSYSFFDSLSRALL